MNPFHPYTVFPLGDAGLIIDFGNIIDEATNKKVLHLFHVLKNSSHPYITDVVPAYSSLAVYYNVIAVCQKKNDKTAFETMAELIEAIIEKNEEAPSQQIRLIEVPVCYAPKFSTDIQYIAQQKNISVDQIIAIHTSKTYRVYMIGFLPGFAYMGQVDERIVIPRKPEPQNVVAGTVGIAGVQTGIYPLDCPGGWQVIGRTPLQLFDKDREQPILFQPGDEIKFYSITEDEFAHYQARHS
ncbi:MAG: 5-oxoprolinase subunit PxpB [Flavisolibacter sp.]|jgi:inhibitor of KinA